MKRSRVYSLGSHIGLVVLGGAAVAQAAGFSLLGVPTSVEVGQLVSLAADCSLTAVPLLSARLLAVLMLLLATTGAVLVKRRGAAWLTVLVALGVSTLVGDPARSADCNIDFDWDATSASESFQHTGPDFDFTPTQPGYMEVMATSGGESVEATIPVCPIGQVADECGICGGDGSACLCLTVLAVGYSATGATCNYQSGTPPNLQSLPGIALDEFTYNEFFTGEGYDASLGIGWGFSTPINGQADHYGTAGRAHGCGACLQVTGENGSAVFWVREIADVGAVGTNGYPRGVHIDSNYIDLVRNGNGVGVDVTIQPVPCPFTGNILMKHRIYNDQQVWYWMALEYMPYNSVYPIKKIEIKDDAFHTQWYDLPKAWTNKYVLGNYEPFPYPQIPLPSPPNGPVRFRITSVYDQVLVTAPIQQAERPLDPAALGWAYYDLGVQFEARPYLEGACSENYFCGNWAHDAGEDCEWTVGPGSVDCADLGLGTGTASCGFGTCTWDTTECSGT